MMTEHARARCQQRAIPSATLDALIAYGECRRRAGADIYYLTRESRARLAKALGASDYRRVEKSLNSYIVLGDDGCVVTAARRRKRLKF